MSLDNIFNVLMATESSAQTISQLQGRNLSLTLGQIVSVNDPEGFNRIQVFLASEGGKSLSPWYYRMLALSRLSMPLDLTGATAVCGYIDGDPHEGIVLGLLVNGLTKMNQSEEELLYQLGSSFVSIKDGAIALSTGNVTLTLSDNDITINGKSILTLGAKDSNGHTAIEKGWQGL